MPRSPQIADVNMTPLVDVMLVVLVLFLITSPLLMAGPQVSLPRVQAERVTLDDTEAVVTIERDGTVYYGEGRLDGSLKGALLADPVFQRSRRLYVRGDRDAAFGVVSSVLDEARDSGVAGVNLIVDPDLFAEEPRP